MSRLPVDVVLTIGVVLSSIENQATLLAFLIREHYLEVETAFVEYFQLQD